MKIRSVIFTKQAEKDLEDIESFLYSMSSKSKNKIFDKIFKKIDLLYEFPMMGQIEPLLRDRAISYHYLIEKPYKIIYSFLGQDIIINRVYDSRQDPQHMVEKLE